jgi:hypothetical protein
MVENWADVMESTLVALMAQMTAVSMVELWVLMMVDKKDDAMVRWKAESMVDWKVYRRVGEMGEMMVET